MIKHFYESQKVCSILKSSMIIYLILINTLFNFRFKSTRIKPRILMKFIIGYMLLVTPLVSVYYFQIIFVLQNGKKKIFNIFCNRNQKKNKHNKINMVKTFYIKINKILMCFIFQFVSNA